MSNKPQTLQALLTYFEAFPNMTLNAHLMGIFMSNLTEMFVLLAKLVSYIMETITPRNANRLFKSERWHAISAYYL